MRTPLRPRLAGALVLGLALAGACGAPGSIASLEAPRLAQSSTIWDRVQARCAAEAATPLPPYPWPIAPVHRQHAVRGYFGDPRTVVSGPGEGAFSFHNGVDISAWTGNHVLPVVSGVVVKVRPDEVVVASSYDRRFQYIHIVPKVTVGEWVVASRTLLGTVGPIWHHVHLSEIRGVCVVNPLMPGHLTPFHDSKIPVVAAILFQNLAGDPVSRLGLSGEVRVIARAFDRPAIPSRYPWGSLPVSPVEITWTLSTLGGRVLEHQVAVDFRYSLPPRRDFCDVYAPGTEQNFAVVSGTFHWRKPGRYFYDLTPSLLDFAALHPGYYGLTVRASNTADHVGARTVVIRVRASRARYEQAPIDARCSLSRAGASGAAAPRAT